MSPRRFKIDQSHPFALEIYGPGGSTDLIWKAECAAPLTVPARGGRIQPMEAKGARPDLFHEIARREQVVRAGGDTICSLTPVFTRPA
ncbi:MAG: hypothetical protein ACK56C_16480 [Alphaproteobacteria bacterium]|jgi:hypothetical protein